MEGVGKFFLHLLLNPTRDERITGKGSIHCNWQFVHHYTHTKKKGRNMDKLKNSKLTTSKAGAWFVLLQFFTYICPREQGGLMHCYHQHVEHVTKLKVMNSL